MKNVEAGVSVPEHEVKARIIVDSWTFLEELEYGKSPIAGEIYRLAMDANQEMKNSESELAE